MVPDFAFLKKKTDRIKKYVGIKREEKRETFYMGHRQTRIRFINFKMAYPLKTGSPNAMSLFENENPAKVIMMSETIYIRYKKLVQ